MRPAKAPAEHEPVIADASTHVAIVVGIDALDSPIAEATHRPERVAALLNIPQHAALDFDGLARLITHPMGGLKDVPDPANVVVVINKVEGSKRVADAAAVAERVVCESRIDRVICGALEGDDPDAWTVYRRDLKGSGS